MPRKPKQATAAFWSEHICTASGQLIDIDDYRDIGAAINDALTVGETLYLPAGADHTFSTAIRPVPSCTIRGHGKWGTALTYTGTDEAIRIDDGATGVTLDGFSLLSDGSAGAVGIQLRADSDSIVKTQIRNIGLAGFDSYSVHEIESGTGQIWDLEYYNISVADTGDDAYHSTATVVEKRLRLFNQSHTSIFKDSFGYTPTHGGDINGHMFLDRGSSWNVVYERCMAEYQVAGEGYQICGTRNLTIRQCNAEGTGGFAGYNFQNCTNLQCEGLKATNNAGHGLIFSNTQSNVFVNGCFTESNGGDDLRLGGGDYSNAILGANEIADGGALLERATIHLGTGRVGDVQTAVTAAYTTGDHDSVVFADSQSGPVPVTLSSSSVAPANSVTILDSGGAAGTNAITIDTEGDETINGAESASITTDHGSVELVSNGTDWFAK